MLLVLARKAGTTAASELTLEISLSLNLSLFLYLLLDTTPFQGILTFFSRNFFAISLFRFFHCGASFGKFVVVVVGGRFSVSRV